MGGKTSKIIWIHTGSGNIINVDRVEKHLKLYGFTELSKEAHEFIRGSMSDHNTTIQYKYNRWEYI